MPLDTQTRNVLDLLAALPPFELDVAKMRARDEEAVPPLDIERAVVHSVEDRFIPGPASDIRIRVYRPLAADRCAEVPPLLLYFHGGGHVIGSLDSYDGVCCQLARSSGCILVSVDYRLAPEHKFPAGPEDGYRALEWIAENGATLGGDPARLAVAGDSAGGNLSAVVCLMARDHGAPRVAYQALIYPSTNGRGDLPSVQRNGSGYLLTKEMIDWFYNQYVVHSEDDQHPHFVPLRAASHADLPPALVITAEFDPLLDEGAAYAERLRAAGVPVEYRCFDGTIHSFFSFYRLIDKGREAIALVGDRVRKALAA